MDTSKLSKAELTALHMLLGKLIGEDEEQVTSVATDNTVTKKRGRPRKEKTTNLVIDQDSGEEVPLVTLKRTKTKKKIKKKEKGNRSSVEQKISQRTGRNSGRVQARKLQLTVPKGGRPNLFEDSPDFNAHKEDTKIDKKLWKGKRPAARGIREPEQTEVDCRICGDTCLIHPSELSPEGRYVCNECVINGSLAEGEDEDGNDND